MPAQASPNESWQQREVIQQSSPYRDANCSTGSTGGNWSSWNSHDATSTDNKNKPYNSSSSSSGTSSSSSNPHSQPQHARRSAIPVNCEIDNITAPMYSNDKVTPYMLRRSSRSASPSSASSGNKMTVYFIVPSLTTSLDKKELSAFSDLSATSAKPDNCEFYFVTPEPTETQKFVIDSLTEKKLITKDSISTLSDQDQSIANTFGVLSSTGSRQRSVVIIDDKYVVRHITSSDPCVGTRCEEVFSNCKAIQKLTSNSAVIPCSKMEAKPFEITPAEAATYSPCQTA